MQIKNRVGDLRLILGALLHLDLLVVAAVRRVPGICALIFKAPAVRERFAGANVLQKLLDEVDVGHDHAPAAVALAPELVQGIAVGPVSSAPDYAFRTPQHTHL